nr:hypothetical protein [Vibrio crassostreae]
MSKNGRKTFCREARAVNPNIVSQRVTPSWTTATLITLERHRDDEGHLRYSESIIKRSWKISASYERVWEQVRVDEPYQHRIKELLNQNKVVLKDVV